MRILRDDSELGAPATCVASATQCGGWIRWKGKLID